MRPLVQLRVGGDACKLRFKIDEFPLLAEVFSADDLPRAPPRRRVDTDVFFVVPQ